MSRESGAARVRRGGASGVTVPVGGVPVWQWGSIRSRVGDEAATQVQLFRAINFQICDCENVEVVCVVYATYFSSGKSVDCPAPETRSILQFHGPNVRNFPQNWHICLFKLALDRECVASAFSYVFTSESRKAACGEGGCEKQRSAVHIERKVSGGGGIVHSFLDPLEVLSNSGRKFKRSLQYFNLFADIQSVIQD